MSQNQPKKSSTNKPKKSSQAKSQRKPGQSMLWALGVCILTGIVFLPMLSNGFTNWDDQFYITSNPMLLDQDWKGIFTRPLMANYHPLTVFSLALNYQLTNLSPFSYHLVNWLLHVLNTGLVFFLAYRLSNSDQWVGLITALLFGLHPMHVESVAWASERKDVLYTFFFLLALLSYLKYIQHPDTKKYITVVLLFILSLLSKPAAVTLPLVLLLMDAFMGRSIKDQKVWLEKIPFFVLSIVFGLLAIKFQHQSQAIVAPEIYPFWQKVIFSFYGFGEYVKRFFWPFPMSAIHPFPETGIIPASFYFGFLVSVLTIVGTWLFRRKKYVWFGVGFYAVNVALVLQLLTFGHAIIAERYTYVPYIGVGFLLSMAWATSHLSGGLKRGILIGLLVFCGFMGISAFQQIKVWKNSGTLWSHAIETYPNSYMARTNRAQYLSAKEGKYEEALVDFAIALQVEPNDSFSLINRATIYINQQNFQAAYADADSLVKYVPHIAKGHYLRGVAAFQLNQPEQALADLTNCIQLDPASEEAYSFRGVVLYNYKQDYNAAKADFDQAIQLNPKMGGNYKNRARCWIKFGNKDEALKDIATAQSLGENVGNDLIQAAQALP